MTADGVAGIIQKGRTVRVLKRSAADHFLPGAYDLPGGGIEPGESPEEGIVREVFEETGLHVTIVRPLGSMNYLMDPDSGKQDKVMMVYLLKVAGNTEVHLSGELDEYRWVSYPQLDGTFGLDDLMGKVVHQYFEQGKVC